VTLDAPAHLSDDYVADDDAKLDLYRRLARAEQPGEIQAVRDELRDRSDDYPRPLSGSCSSPSCARWVPRPSGDGLDQG